MKVYFSVDGDDIGQLIEKGFLNNDISYLISISLEIEKWLTNIKTIISGNGGTIFISGGDMLLALIDQERVDQIIESISFNQHKFSFTCSISTGRTLIESYVALKQAKSRGKNRIVNLLKDDLQPCYESIIIEI
jgi:GTP cyclohydrolase III